MLDWRNHTGLLLSLFGNVLLAGAVSWLLLSRQTPVAGTVPLPGSDGAKQGVDTPSRDWTGSRLASADDALYARNLRALGLPEKNVVDLIVGEITARYAELWRREAGAAPAYWQSAGIAAATEQARLHSLRARLTRERREAIQRVLGVQALAALAKYRLWDDADADVELDFLAEAKRAPLAAIRARYTAVAKDPALLDEAEVRAAAADEARERADIAALLSPRELEDWDLRRSATAERLREELRGFDATEAEFRQLFRIRRAYEATLETNPDVRDPNVLQLRIAAERRFVEEARATLGEERYADYQRARDPDFQNALQISRYHGLPAETATRIYDLKRTVDARADGITSNSAVSEERQRDLLAQMQRETESALRSLLGDDVLAQYRRNNRWWRFDE